MFTRPEAFLLSRVKQGRFHNVNNRVVKPGRFAAVKKIFSSEKHPSLSARLPRQGFISQPLRPHGSEFHHFYKALDSHPVNKLPYDDRFDFTLGWRNGKPPNWKLKPKLKTPAIEVFANGVPKDVPKQSQKLWMQRQKQVDRKYPSLPTV